MAIENGSATSCGRCVPGEAVDGIQNIEAIGDADEEVQSLIPTPKPEHLLGNCGGLDHGEQGHLDRMAELPQISGLISINRMLLPQNLNSDRDLREAAARLQADLILLYTFDTSFYDRDLSKPLTILTLGLSPTRKIHIATTASALLLDTRTGYVYSAYEATQSSDTLATACGSEDAADAGRRQNEREAFSKLVDELVASWPKFLDRYAKPG